MIDFLTAIALIFILEGLLLFISPSRLKKALEIIRRYSENNIRFVGMIAIIIGIVLLWIIRK